MELQESHGKQYKVCNGTYYHAETSDEMVALLEQIRRYGTRVRFHWGNAQTGEDWGDIYDVAGTIGRSTGEVKIPLLIHNRRSLGGGGILTNCIVKIVTTRGGHVMYQHPNYHVKD